VTGKEYLNNITVTLQNQGDFPESFNITVRANATDIETKEITLASGNMRVIIFKWNTTSARELPEGWLIAEQKIPTYLSDF